MSLCVFPLTYSFDSTSKLEILKPNIGSSFDTGASKANPASTTINPFVTGSMENECIIRHSDNLRAAICIRRFCCKRTANPEIENSSSIGKAGSSASLKILEIMIFTFSRKLSITSTCLLSRLFFTCMRKTSENTTKFRISTFLILANSLFRLQFYVR